MNATAAASSLILIEHSTAPSIGTALCASSISGMLGAMIATVSPVPTPARASADAAAGARSSRRVPRRSCSDVRRG